MRFWLLALPSYLFHDFHLLEPLPLRQRKGFFFAPKHSHEKFVRKFFQIYPRRLFAHFLARICDEGKGCLLPAYGGGTPFFVGLWACGLVAAFLFVAFPLSLWASVPYWLTASGAPEPIGAAGPVVFLVLLGGAWLPRLDSLGSIRTTGNRGKGAAVPSFLSVLIG